jgi:hypothetical protein
MPTDEEVDEFVELYTDEDLTVREIADVDGIDWSKSTVSKHLRRRGVLGDDTDDEPDEREYTEGIGFEADDIPEPMDLLLEIMEKDPDLKEEHAEYVLSFEDLYGVIGTSDVGEILRQVKIANKQMVISRVNSRFTKTIQRYLNENPDLVYHEKWRRLIEKETGQDLSHVERQGANMSGIGIGVEMNQPGSGPQQQGQLSLPQQAMPGNGQQPGRQPNQNGHTQRGAEPRHEPNRAGRSGEARRDPEPQGGSGTDERLIEAIDSLNERIDQIEEKVDSGQSEEPSESQGSFSEIKQFMQLQQEMEGLLDGLGDSEDVDEEVIETVRQEIDGRLSRLETMVQESAADSQPAPDPTPDMVENEMFQIAQLAEVVDSEETLVELAKMQSDPEVMQAQAKAQSEQKDAEWKAKIAENLSPRAIEKGVDALLGMTGAVGGGQPQQQTQSQPAQQQQGGRDVQVVDSEPQPEPEAEPGADNGSAVSDGLDGSPMRKEAMSEKVDVSDGETEGETEEESGGEPEAESESDEE